MSNPGTPTAAKPIIPSITGYPALDTMLRGMILSGASAIAAVIVTWANAHGFASPDLSLEITGAIAALLVVAATFAWSFVQTRLNQLSTTQHVITAAATGEIPEAIKVAAVKAPSISEEEITKALNNAETIKAQQ